MSVRIINADVFDGLSQLEDESIHCCVCSPPYWGLRDYGGVEGQIGLEPTLAEHLETMVRVFEEVRRVLRKDGTLWLNYGDCYATSPNGRSAADTKSAGNDDRTFRDKPFSTVGPIYVADHESGDRRGKEGNKQHTSGGMAGNTGRVVAGVYLKPKDLCMLSNRLAIALQDAGWWVRSEIIWAKPNPMPESVTDRPTTSHEKIWLLSKSAKYFYDAEAVREPASYLGPNSPESIKSPYGQGFTRRADKGNANGFRGGSYVNGEPGPRTKKGNKQRGHGRRHDGFNDRWDLMSKEEQQSFSRNCRNVWTVATKPFADAHFATFPPEIPEKCIKAGCPEGGIVLDIFGGAGTTGLVADRLGRDAILIELNPDYAEMARKRIESDGPLFADVTAPVQQPDSQSDLIESLEGQDGG